ncbi:hypothetical protein BGW37DRAFT_139640 [Umbelopsis sp. PMI_123]|nr:hypothetical protein BGW37DRAFT_139640 [Umbelopsis sp. PMI_123]
MLANYLHRLYPLQRARMWWSAMRPTPKDVIDRRPFDNANGVQQITNLFRAIDMANQSNLPQTDHLNRVDTLYRSFGFQLNIKPSSLPGAGDGVYVNGVRDQDQIVSVYPGTIYMASEPLLFASLRNRYILKCVDGVFVDGKNTGLSARIHRSLHKRDNWPGAVVTSDDTWLTDYPRNPLAVGQIVNNNRYANVRYQEIDIPANFPLELRKYIPNLYLTDRSIESSWRLVALIATRRIENEELFSTYFECVY